MFRPDPGQTSLPADLRVLHGLCADHDLNDPETRRVIEQGIMDSWKTGKRAVGTDWGRGQ